ncbi:MAG: metallophosphoesterase family protein [Anaerolineae bacterium]|nr:metallophosphoesterase family protein [Anaerolineae bacterium]
MKIALIGDVHANLPALETVLNHAHQQGSEAIWNIGDWVGYNAFPNQVIQRLRQEHAVSIVGNYDLKVLKFKQKKDKWRHTKRPEKYLAFKWAYQNLSKEHRAYLRSLPQEIRLTVAGWPVLLTHGSPASNNEAITAATPEARLHELAQMAQAEVIICGHSHRPCVRRVDKVWFINTGSVGRPDDGDPRATYAILQLEPDSLQVRHYRLAYDVDKAVEAIRYCGLPAVFGEMLRQGRNLDEVLARQNL